VSTLTSLGDLVEITSSKRVFYADYQDCGVPFYRSKEIIQKAKGVGVTTELFISEDHFSNIKKKFGVPREGDLLLTAVGTIGIPYLVQRREKFYFKDGNLIWFRNFSNKLNSGYLYYWLISEAGRLELAHHTIGSTQQALTIQGLKKVKIPLLPISEQNRIVKLLDGISEQIALNSNINEKLEQIGEALFRHWFVDFQFPDDHGKPYKLGGGQFRSVEAEHIPTVWQLGTLDQTATIVSGGTPSTSRSDYWNGSIPWYSVVDAPQRSDMFAVKTQKSITKDGLENSAAKQIEKGALIISARGTVGKMAIAGIPMTINQSCYALESTHPYYTYRLFSYHLENIKSRTHGSVFDTITRETFTQINAPIPSEKVLNQFEDMVSPLFERALVNTKENIRLTELRESLSRHLLASERVNNES
jgi:type I restriction enzyme, S subunit